MATQVGLDTFVRYHPIDAPRFNLKDKISGLTATEIEYISLNVAEKIIENLGPEPKLAILDRELKEKGDYCQIREMAIARQSNWMTHNPKPFLSELNTNRFTNFLLDPIKEMITEAFSTPSKFLEVGITINLYYDAPERILEKAAAKIPIIIQTTYQVPYRYHVILTADQQSKLVFTLTQMSGDYNFSIGQIDSQITGD